MKILHTSDWHLGHSLYKNDRTEEQLSMLMQMVKIVEQEKPDVFLLCGDVYDSSQPSAAVQTMFANYLVKIHDAHPGITIVVTAGNHDSGSKHDIFQIPWRALNVYTVGVIDNSSISGESYDKHIIEIPGKGYVIAIPYMYERYIPEGFFQNVLDDVNRRNKDNLPVVMSAHTTVKGCDFSGHEDISDYAVGGIEAIDIAQLGDGYDYLALGHIHRPQFVNSVKRNVRYCGSPVPVSFDENYKNTVSIVEIDKHGSLPVIREIEINNPHPLVTLPETGFVPWEDAKKLFRDYPENIPSYIRLNVEVDGFLPPEANLEAVDIAKGKQCRFCLINAKKINQPQDNIKSLTVQELQKVDPIDITRKYAKDSGLPFDEEMESLFKEAFDMVRNEERK